MKKLIGRAFPKTRLVSGKAMGKAAKNPLSKSKAAFPKLKFWEGLGLLVLFLSTGTIVHSQQSIPLSEAVQTAAQRIEQEIGSGKRVAVLNFISSSQELSTYVVDELMDIFTNHKILEVTERYRMDAILRERNHQTSGEVGDDEIKSIGNQVGAKFVVTGQLNYDGMAYRFRIYAIDIEEGTRIASTSVNIRNNDQRLSYFLNGAEPPNEEPRSKLLGIFVG
jgi:TolB-like protein